MASYSPDTDGAIVGINVTPLVDITLVLLIIFIVTAKMITSSSIPLDLPKSARSVDEPTVLSVVLAKDGSAQVDSNVIATDDALMPIARDASARAHALRAVIKADSAVPHGRIIHILDLLKQAGLSNIAFATPPGPHGLGGN